MKLTGIKHAQSLMTLDEIFEAGNDPNGLLKDVKINSKSGGNGSALSRNFEAVNQFIDMHGRVPDIDSSEITEALLAESLKAICDKSFDDPALNIDWPIDLSKAILSEKDKKQPTLKEFEKENTFVYQEV